jgi:hypothetical protein
VTLQVINYCGSADEKHASNYPGGKRTIITDESIEEAYQFVRKVAMWPEPNDWQPFLMRVARILTGTVDDPSVTDADIMEFIDENAVDFRKVCRITCDAIRIVETGKWVH